MFCPPTIADDKVLTFHNMGYQLVCELFNHDPYVLQYNAQEPKHWHHLHKYTLGQDSVNVDVRVKIGVKPILQGLDNDADAIPVDLRWDYNESGGTGRRIIGELQAYFLEATRKPDNTLGAWSNHSGDSIKDEGLREWYEFMITFP